MTEQTKPKRGSGPYTKYKPEYCDKAREYLAEGNTIQQLAVAIRTPYRTIMQWASDRPEFRQALDDGVRASEAHWQRKIATELLVRKDVNQGVLKLLMHNMFGWHDNKKVENSGESTITIKWADK